MSDKEVVLDCFADNLWDGIRQNCQASMAGPLREQLVKLYRKGFENRKPAATPIKAHAFSYLDGFLDGMTLAICMVQNGDLEVYTAKIDAEKE